jgi:spore germination protein GerM
MERKLLPLALALVIFAGVILSIFFFWPQRIRVFFSNSTLDPAHTCASVFPVSRNVRGIRKLKTAALAELLKGPSSEEIGKGYFTSIPSNAKLLSLRKENNVVYADFDEALDRGVAGSCRVSAIRAQISETLKQFPGVEAAVISIDGRRDDILQP